MMAGLSRVRPFFTSVPPYFLYPLVCGHKSLAFCRAPRAHLSLFLRYTQEMGILRRLSRCMGKQEQMTHIVTGNTAPGFSLKALDKKEYSLINLLERGPVVAAFFKISCPVCQFTFPFLERLYRRYGGHNVTFLGVSPHAPPSTPTFSKKYCQHFP